MAKDKRRAYTSSGQRPDYGSREPPFPMVSRHVRQKISQIRISYKTLKKLKKMQAEAWQRRLKEFVIEHGGMTPLEYFEHQQKLREKKR